MQTKIYSLSPEKMRVLSAVRVELFPLCMQQFCKEWEWMHCQWFAVNNEHFRDDFQYSILPRCRDSVKKISIFLGYTKYAIR